MDWKQQRVRPRPKFLLGVRVRCVPFGLNAILRRDPARGWPRSWPHPARPLHRSDAKSQGSAECADPLRQSDVKSGPAAVRYRAVVRSNGRQWYGSGCGKSRGITPHALKVRATIEAGVRLAQCHTMLAASLSCTPPRAPPDLPGQTPSVLSNVRRPSTHGSAASTCRADPGASASFKVARCLPAAFLRFCWSRFPQI